jgi:hypothetical protein
MVAAEDQALTGEVDSVGDAFDEGAKVGGRHAGVAAVMVDLVAGRLDQHRAVIRVALAKRSLDDDRMGGADGGQADPVARGVALRQVEEGTSTQAELEAFLNTQTSRCCHDPRYPPRALLPDRECACGAGEGERLSRRQVAEPEGDVGGPEGAAGAGRVDLLDREGRDGACPGCVIARGPLGAALEYDRADAAGKKLAGGGIEVAGVRDEKNLLAARRKRSVCASTSSRSCGL